MSHRPLFGALALLVAAAGLTAALAPQDKSKPQPAAAGADDPMALMAPGPEHKVLESRVGKWTSAFKMWAPGTDQAMESTGSSEFQWMLGNRYLTETARGDMMGMPFEGFGVTGYDRMKKKYFSTWFDNMGTGVLASEGTYDPATKSITLTGKMPDMMSGKEVDAKLIHREIDANSFVFEMHMTDGQSSKMSKVLEITYTRAK